jgi:hypothetical protein
LGIPVDYQVPLNDTWNVLFRRPWMVPIAIFEYLFWGKGALTIQHSELATFMRSELIDKDGNFIPPNEGKLDPKDPQNCPDFEVVIVSFRIYISYANSNG